MIKKNMFLKMTLLIGSSILWMCWVVQTIKFMDNKFDNLRCMHFDKLFSFCSLKFLGWYVTGMLTLIAGAAILFVVCIYASELPIHKKTTTTEG